MRGYTRGTCAIFLAAAAIFAIPHGGARDVATAGTGSGFRGRGGAPPRGGVPPPRGKAPPLRGRGGNAPTQVHVTG